MPRSILGRLILSSCLVTGAAVWVPPAVLGDLGPLEPIADLHRAVHESLGLPEPMIVRALERGLPDADLPVVGLIAARASVPVESVVDLRLGGMSYADITVRFGLSPEIFYVPFDVDPGPPYYTAWTTFRTTPRERWRTLRLADVDVVHYANLRLCVDRYHVAPIEVVALGRKGRGFAAIHHELVLKAKPAKADKETSGGKPKSKAKAAKSKAKKADKKAKPSKPGKPPAH